MHSLTPSTMESIKHKNQASVAKKIGLAALSVLFALIVAEIMLRIFSPYGFMTPAIRKKNGLPYEPAVFARHIFGHGPHLAYDGPLEYRINTLGYRGKDFAFNKPENTARIVVLGGSAVFDLAAEEGRDWPHLTQRKLNELGIHNVEVINAGIPGHTSADSLGRLFAEVHLMQPDIVVLYNTWNDIKAFASNKPLLRYVKPYSGDPRVDYYNTADRLLCNMLQVYERARARMISARYRVGREGAATTETMATGLAPAAAMQFKLNVQMFCDLARNIGAEPVLMTQARLVAYTNDDEERSKIEYHKIALDHDRICDAFEMADEIIRETAETKNAAIVDAAAYATGDLRYCYDHIHTTAEGSDLLALLLAEKCSDILAAK